jgi:hypothetical protein
MVLGLTGAQPGIHPHPFDKLSDTSQYLGTIESLDEQGIIGQGRLLIHSHQRGFAQAVLLLATRPSTSSGRTVSLKLRSW